MVTPLFVKSGMVTSLFMKSSMVIPFNNFYEIPEILIFKSKTVFESFILQLTVACFVSKTVKNPVYLPLLVKYGMVTPLFIKSIMVVSLSVKSGMVTPLFVKSSMFILCNNFSTSQKC